MLILRPTILFFGKLHIFVSEMKKSFQTELLGILLNQLCNIQIATYLVRPKVYKLFLKHKQIRFNKQAEQP